MKLNIKPNKASDEMCQWRVLRWLTFTSVYVISNLLNAIYKLNCAVNDADVINDVIL